MGINLQKGQRVSLGLSNIEIGLGWDPNPGTGNDFDLDASAFMLGDNGKLPTDAHFIFYNNLVSPDGAVEGAEDDQTGGSSDGGDDEVININLTKVAANVTEIVFVVTIHDSEGRKQNFGQVRNSYIRIVDSARNEEIAKYELDEDFSIETGVEFGRVYKRGNEWKFEAVGQGYNGGLEFFVGKYQ